MPDDSTIVSHENCNVQSYKTGFPKFDVTLADLHSSSISTVYQSDTEDVPKYTSALDVLSATNADVPYSEKSDTVQDIIADYTAKSGLETSLKRVEAGLKTHKMLYDVFHELCTIESQYITRLENLKNSIDLSNSIETPRTTASLKSFKLYLNRTVENHRDFMDAISNECVISAHEHRKQLDYIYEGLDNSKEEYLASETKWISYINKIEDNYLQTKTAVSICTEAIHQAPSIKTNLHIALIPVLLNFFNSNDRLCLTDINLNEAKLEMFRKFDKIKSKLHRLDAARVMDIRDNLCKYMIYETAKIRNLQYDITALIDTLNNFDPSEDIEFPHHTSVDDSPSTQERDATNLKKADGFVVPDVFNYHAISRLALSPPPARVITKIEKRLEGFILSVWNDELDDLSIDGFPGEMHSSLVRQIFCTIVANQALKSNELPSLQSLKMLGRMVSIILSISERQADSWCGYTILRFSDSIYSTTPRSDNPVNRCYLRSVIYSHTYWSKIPFWEECLTIVVSLDLKSTFETTQYLETQKSRISLLPSTESALSFYKWMIKYGVPPQDCIDLIQKVCTRLKLPESYANYLLNK